MYLFFFFILFLPWLQTESSIRAEIFSALLTPGIFREGLSEKVKFEQRPEEEVNTIDTNMLWSTTSAWLSKPFNYLDPPNLANTLSHSLSPTQGHILHSNKNCLTHSHLESFLYLPQSIKHYAIGSIIISILQMRKTRFKEAK